MEAHTSDTSESKFKQLFEEKLRDYEMHHQGSFRRPWTNKIILEVISNVKKARVSMTNTKCRTSMSYYWILKYDVMTTGSEEYLIFKRKSPDDPVIRIVPREEYFIMLNTIHKDCGHGGRDKMVYNIKSRFYITKKAVEIFVSLCPTCNTKRNIPRKGIVTRPIVSQDFNIRGQVDLIDFQSCPDGDYKWLLNYQDNATKFLNLRPLKTKMASEVATELMKIFLIFGAPYILQSDNGREFTAKIIKELVAMWPECKIVHGSPRRPQTQGSVERSNQDVENMIRSWMTDKNSTIWSIGCFFCQYQKNASFHRIIGRSPYKTLFGGDPKAGLTGSSIPFHLLSNIETEQDLIKLSDDEPPQRLIETTTSNVSMIQNDVNQIASTSHGHPIITEDCENPDANMPAESDDGTESCSEPNQINNTGIIQVFEVVTDVGYNPANFNNIDKDLEIIENIEPKGIAVLP